MAAKKAKRAAYYIELAEGQQSDPDSGEPSLGDWWIRIRSGRNGQIVFTSEVYETKAKARQSARRFAAATGLEVREAK